MEIKNDMESLVRAEVTRRKESSGKEAAACWCALCEADVVALALNRLPPRYCQRQNFGYAASQQGLAFHVRSAVSYAVDKVSKRPKHRPGAPDRFRSEVRLENFALRIGHSVVGTALADAACSCEQCRSDALAYALNRYPPKYGVSAAGRESYQSNFEDFIRHELGELISRASRVVAASPHH